MEFIDALKKEIRISVAHTAADYEQACEAFSRGARQVTHLYNAMLPLTHRSPGVIGAACERDEVMPELICDGIHIHPSVIRATFKMFGADRILLISDSMMGKSCHADSGRGDRRIGHEPVRLHALCGQGGGDSACGRGALCDGESGTGNRGGPDPRQHCDRKIRGFCGDGPGA